MKTKLLSLIIVVALSASAFAKPEVFLSPNPVTGKTSVAIRNNFVRSKGPFSGDFQFTAAKLVITGGEKYVLSVIYSGTKWIFIQGPLVINIDGEVVTFKPAGIGPSRQAETGSVSESVPYDTDREGIAKIANASKIIMQVGGSNGAFFLTLKPENIAIFREFLAKTKPKEPRKQEALEKI